MKLCVECNTHYDDVSEACPADGTGLVEVGNDPLIGLTIGERYRILHVLGKGSMGIVYKAIQLSSGREMAVKFLLRNTGSAEPAEATLKRFQREAKTLSSLKHPNIVTLFDFGFTEDRQPYLVTEFLHGLTLTQLLKQNSYLDPKKCLAAFRQVCDAVTEAHHHKVVHRDIKPDNIFLQGKDQGGRFIKVLDFGISKLLNDAGASSSLTMDGRVCGSPAYMSPEQCKGLEVDFRCDIYSLAVVIFETLTGRRLFVGDDAMSVMFAHVNEPAPMLSSVRNDPLFTPELELVMQRALAKEPRRRQQSINEFWDEFSAAAQGKTLKNKGASAAVGWIPFAAPAPKMDLQVARDELDSLASGDQNKKSVMYLHEFRRKQRQFFTRVVFIVCCLVLTYMLFDSTRDKVTVETAEVLASHGRPEDAVKFLERLKQQRQLTGDDVERLNNAYLRTAMKYARRRQYSDAVDMLQKVSPRSKYSNEASELMRKYRHLKAQS